MGEASGGSRRDRILRAAEREFSTRGFAGARMERIATAAGVNKQLLFHYFHSKQGLHEAAVGASLQSLDVTPPTGSQPSARLRTLIERLQEAAAHSPAVLGLLSAPDAAGRLHGDAVLKAGAWLRAAIRSACAVLEDGQRSGHLRDDVEVEPVAELIVSSALGAATAGVLGADAEAENRPERIRETLVRLVMDHCSWR